MKLALCLVFLLASTPALASEATDLAALAIAAYGGPEAIERLKTVKHTGKLDSYRYGETGTIERTFSRPDKLRVDIQIPGAPPGLRVLNGTRGWREGREDKPMMARAMLLQAARLDLPYLIMKAGSHVSLYQPENGGKEEGARKSLEIPMAEGLRLIAVIDTRTGYIVTSRGLFTVAPGHEMEFTTIYADHTEENGIVFAVHEAHFVRGQPTGKTTIEKSEVLQDLPDSVFRP